MSFQFAVPLVGYTLMAHAQAPPAPPPQQPPAPATALVLPLPSDEKAAKTENTRRDSLPQSGHGVASSIRLIERRLSKRLEQVMQVYS